MEADNSKNTADPGVFGLISALGVLGTLALFIWFFKAYVYDAPIVTTFFDAGMFYSADERLLIWPVAVITLVAAILASRRTGGGMVRPGTYIPAVVLILLGLLELAPYRRAMVGLYYGIDSDLSRIDRQVESIFHPAYGDLLTEDPGARAQFKQAARSGSSFVTKDEAALILYAMDRLEGKTALRIALGKPEERRRFLRVLAMEKKSPYAGHIKAPPKIAPAKPEAGFQLGFIKREEARAVFEKLTTPGALAKASLADLVRMRLIIGSRPKLAPGAEERLLTRLRTFFAEADYPRGRFWQELVRLSALVAKPDGTVPLRIRVAPGDPKKKIPELSQSDALKAVTETLAVFGRRATKGDALTIDLSLNERWVATRLFRTKTTTRAVQKRRPYTSTRDPLRFQTYTKYVDEKKTVRDNVSLRLPVMTVAMSAGGQEASIVLRAKDGANDKPVPGPLSNRKIVDALSERDCLKYSILCFKQLTTRRLSPLYTNYEIDAKALLALPARP